MSKNNFVLIRGGGDLATGVALRLHRVGIKVLITELPQPLAVRRTVSFAEAVYEGAHTVEGVKARLIGLDQLPSWKESEGIPVVIDPDLNILSRIKFPVVVDARLTKQTPAPLPAPVPLHIGLGPGFRAQHDCHAVIETRRSHTLGRVIWDGASQPDNGEPEGDPRRVLRAPVDGLLRGVKRIGEHVEEGDVIAVIGDQHPVVSFFGGVLRGLLHDRLYATKGLKIGDLDPRNDPAYCYQVSDKALAIGGGVLEAILSRREIREKLFG